MNLKMPSPITVNEDEYCFLDVVLQWKARNRNGKREVLMNPNYK